MSKKASSNSAALRAQQMAFASGGFSGGGFGSDESLSFYNTNAEQQMIFRKLDKKDAVTRRKGLEELKKIVEELSEEEQDGFLQRWAAQFNDLIEDTDMRVREASVKLMEQIAKKVGRKLATHLKVLMSPWLLARFDPRVDVKSAAIESFKNSIPEAKHVQSLLFAKNEILNDLHEKFQYTVQTLKDKKIESDHEAEEKFERVVSCAILTLDFLLETLPDDECHKLDQDLLSRVLDDKFWALCSSKFANVRLAAYTLIKTLSSKLKPYVESRVETFSSVVFGLFADKDPVSHKALWDAVLAFLQAYPSRFPTATYKKTLLPKLSAFLSAGCFGSGEPSYSSLLPFLSLLPDSSEVLFDSEFVNKFMQALWKGVRSDAVTVGRKDKSGTVPVVEAYMDCVFLFVVKGSKAAGRDEFVKQVLDTHLFPIFDAFFKYEEVISPALVPSLVTLLERLEARAECHKWLDLFWTAAEATISKNRTEQIACDHAAEFVKALAKSQKACTERAIRSLKTLFNDLPEALRSDVDPHIKLLEVIAEALFGRQSASESMQAFDTVILPCVKEFASISSNQSLLLAGICRTAFLSVDQDNASRIWDAVASIWAPSAQAAAIHAFLEKGSGKVPMGSLQRAAVDEMVLNVNFRGFAAMVASFVSKPGLLLSSTLESLGKACMRVFESSAASDAPLLLGSSKVASALLSATYSLPLAGSILRLKIKNVISGIDDATDVDSGEVINVLARSPAPAGNPDEHFLRPLLTLVRDSVEEVKTEKIVVSLAAIAGDLVNLASKWGALSQSLSWALYARSMVAPSVQARIQTTFDLCKERQVYILAQGDSTSTLPLRHILKYQTIVMEKAGAGLFSRSHLLSYIFAVAEVATALQWYSVVEPLVGAAIVAPSAADLSVAVQTLDSLFSLCTESSGSALAFTVAGRIVEDILKFYQSNSASEELAENVVLTHYLQKFSSLPVGLSSSIFPVLISHLKPVSQTLSDIRKRVFERFFLPPQASFDVQKDSELAVALELAQSLVATADDAEQRKLLSSFVPLAKFILANVDSVSGSLSCALLRFCYHNLLDQFDMKISPAHWDIVLDICRVFIQRELAKQSKADVQILNQCTLLLRSICTMESSKFEWARLSVDVFPGLFDVFATLDSSSLSSSETFSRNLARVLRLVPLALLRTLPTGKLYDTITAMHVESQFTSYSLLKSLAQDKLAAATSRSPNRLNSSSSSVGRASASSSDAIEEEEIDTTNLDPELKHLLEDADMYASSETDAPHKRFHTELGLLLSWSLLLEHLDPSVAKDAKLRSDVGTYVRRLGLLDFILSLVFAHLQEGSSPDNIAEIARDLEASKIEQLWATAQNLDEDDDAEAQLLSSVSAHLFRRVLEALPAMVRSWWTSLGNRLLRAQVEKFTTKLVSPLLIPRELARAAEWKDPSCDYFSVRSSPVTNEVSATYQKDEAELTIVLKIPASYPLNSVAVDMAQKMGVAEALWRKWLLSMTTLLLTRDGTVLDAVLLWKGFLDKHFEGVDVCPICYSIFHISNHALPNLACKTCRNKFHSACLYKWFNTSRKNECPLCKTAFN